MRAKTPFVLSSLVLAASSTTAQAGIVDAILDTTPAGLVHKDGEPRNWKQFWSETKEGAAQIMNEGNTAWVLPTYTDHPNWAWDNRAEQNAYPFGFGIARMHVDDHNNERMFFGVTFVDSNYRPEPMFGYQWVKRFPIGDSGFHLGAGYLVGITARADYLWAPVPLPLPVAKIGFENLGFYMAYIPFCNVGFFYTALTIDDKESRQDPLPDTSPWVKTPNLLFAGGGIEYVDNDEEYSQNTLQNNWAWNVGLRHYSGRNWQTELKYKHADHTVRQADGRGYDALSIETYSLTIAYNIDVSEWFRLYAGAGFGYSIAKSGQGHKDTNLHPSLTMGFTWAMTDHLFITGSMDTNTSRFTGVIDSRERTHVLKPMPTDFTLNIGVAF